MHSLRALHTNKKEKPVRAETGAAGHLKNVAISTAVAASLLAGTVLNPTDATAARAAEQLVAPTVVMEVEQQSLPPAPDADLPEERKKRVPQGPRAKLCAFYRRLPRIWQVVVFLPFLALGKALSVVVSGAAAAVAGPAMGAAAGAVVDMLTLGGAVVGAHALLYPGKALLTRKNLTLMGAGIAALLLADALLTLLAEPWQRVRPLVGFALGAAIFTIILLKISHRHHKTM